MTEPKKQCGHCVEYELPGVICEGWCNIHECDAEPENEGCGHWDDGE